MSLANYWNGANSFPSDVKRLFSSSSYSELNNAEMLLGIPEHSIRLGCSNGAAAVDLFVLARAKSGLISMVVESRVGEPFDSPFTGIRWWKETQLDSAPTVGGLANIVELSLGTATSIRYQLLHRAAAVLIEADQYSADIAVMLVQSFSREHERFEDYEALAMAFGERAETNKLIDTGVRHGRRLFIGWLCSPDLG